MNLAIVYSNDDQKLRSSSYSWTYRDMFQALIARFEEVQHVTKSCSAEDIKADVIVFFDVHSTHEIVIDGVKNHKAVKIEYFNDPHQKDHDFARYGTTVHKLGAEQRTKRAIERGVDYIICPYKNGYFKYISPYIDNAEKRLLWFPVAPKNRLKDIPKLSERRSAVLANGSIWEGEEDFRPYEFRRWAFNKPYIHYAKEVAVGGDFQLWLSRYAGALALCDTYVVPKYIEIPLSGCLCFAQELAEYRELGFEGGKNCIFVNKDNLQKCVSAFLSDVSYFQEIADAGRKQALNYTADKFADFVYEAICQTK